MKLSVFMLLNAALVWIYSGRWDILVWMLFIGVVVWATAEE